MNDIINCLFSKTPVSPKVPLNHTELIIIQWPEACYKIGEPELVYAYIGIALVIPVILLLWNQRLIFREKCVRRGEEDDDGTHFTGDDGAPVRGGPATFEVLEKVRKLAAKKAGRSKLYELTIDASSSQTVLGQITILFALLSSLISFAVYLKRTFKRPVNLELCGAEIDGWSMLDILANLYLVGFFCLRYVGSHKKLQVICSLHSFGDYFNVPTVLLTCILHRRFTGFGFFRIYNVLWLVDIVTNRSLIQSAVKIRVVRLLTLVITIIIIAAGFLHLAECQGDPFLTDDEDGSPIYNGQLVPYWRVLLYVYGRLTLLDLSGIRLFTHTGRITIFLFQLLAVGIIGKAIPAIVSQIKILPEYDKPYESTPSHLHIIVAGSVTSAAIKNFLLEFYNKDRVYSEHFKIVILNEEPPDEDMESLVERYRNKLEYKRGSMMKLKDLHLVKLTSAAASLILANQTARDAQADDSANIMRVVSIKNLKGDSRVIVQVSQYHNKAYLQNIPSWSSVNGDAIICIAELRLGLLAQSCQAPGFSTMVANFFTTRSFDRHAKHKDDWMVDYCRGAALELYYRVLSPAFHGMTFSQACEMCYVRLKIVLLAIQDDPERCDNQPAVVNPGPEFIIRPGAMGYFLADSREEVVRASYYCLECHADIINPEEITKCDCDAKQRKYPADHINLIYALCRVAWKL